ncbi:MAG: response regulator [Anaerolineales bacterium]|nr:response regulator [Anaerolineales bacterium]
MDKKVVLCIEDNSTNMLLVSRVVEAEGHTLVRAEDSQSAIHELEQAVPDIILLDVNLPGMNGLDLARQLRQEERYSTVPIIAITANVLVGDREKCLEAGCNDYMPKPIDIRKLRELMRMYMPET